MLKTAGTILGITFLLVFVDSLPCTFPVFVICFSLSLLPYYHFLPSSPPPPFPFTFPVSHIHFPYTFLPLSFTVLHLSRSLYSLCSPSIPPSLPPVHLPFFPPVHLSSRSPSLPPSLPLPFPPPPKGKCWTAWVFLDFLSSAVVRHGGTRRCLACMDSSRRIRASREPKETCLQF